MHQSQILLSSVHHAGPLKLTGVLPCGQAREMFGVRGFVPSSDYNLYQCVNHSHTGRSVPVTFFVSGIWTQRQSPPAASGPRGLTRAVRGQLLVCDIVPCTVQSWSMTQLLACCSDLVTTGSKRTTFKTQRNGQFRWVCWRQVEPDVEHVRLASIQVH